jgi:hypothetical protein
LRFEDIDWTDDRFASREAMIDAVRSEGVRDLDAITISDRSTCFSVEREAMVPHR